MTKKLWILTEERPKKEVIVQILKKFIQHKEISAFFDTMRIIPILDDASLFTSKYKILGVTSPALENIYLRIISGNSSFVDYLVYFQDEEPNPTDVPLFAIEETKTDDAESRNTGVFQRATKFVYVDIFYPDVDKTMLYNIKVTQKTKPTQTNIFGTKCFRSLGVHFLGKKESLDSLCAFSSVEDLIAYKDQMRKPPAGNVPITVKKIGSDLINISGRLVKNGGLSHDPNIGALSLISAALRKLGWTKRIQITQHGLIQSMVRPTNKFVQIAHHLEIEIEGIEVPKAKFPDAYWHYESKGEKLGTIFVHLAIEEFSEGFSIYENHAGCERGYFYTSDGKPLSISKRVPDANGVMLKSAGKIAIPDLIVLDKPRSEIINIEGERTENAEAGIKQLETFLNIEQFYIKRYYPAYKILRTVVLYGGVGEKINQLEVSFLLNKEGRMVLGLNAPGVFKDTVKNLVSFWRSGQQ
jgi:hypothetical protein